MFIFYKGKKAHHFEYRVEECWSNAMACKKYRLVRYRFDKKDRLIEESPYDFLGWGDRKWAEAQMRHYGISLITSPMIDDDSVVHS